jgi:DNA-binding transcriptional LysR family regulator
MRWNQLEGFYYVARLGNYSRAAEAFPYPIGQPAVYQQVKNLQEDLGVRLVRQAGPRRTELTPEGRALFEFITPFFEGLPRIAERLRGAVATPLVIATDQFLAMEALPLALRRAQEQQPEFRVRIEELPTEEIVERVARGQADVGLLHFAAKPGRFECHELGRIGVQLLIPSSHPLAQLGRMPTKVEVIRHPLIVYEPNSPGRKLTERYFRNADSRLRIAAEVTFSFTMRALVAAGVAPAFVPHLISGPGVKPHPNDKSSGMVSFDVSPQLRGGALRYGLLYRPEMDESASLQLLRKSFRQP